MSGVSACRYCGAPMRWVVYASGKRAPVNVVPDPEGTIVLEPRYHPSGAQRARVMTKDERASYEGERFTSHHATCPKLPPRPKRAR